MMTDTLAWPVKTREVAVPPFTDSARWNDFEFRDDDVVIATYAKCGTTLTQQIVAQLILDGDPSVFGMAQSPWIETIPLGPVPDMIEVAKAQTHRRFLKTHLALDTLVYSPRAKYITVGRDPRDVIWSFHNHLIGFRAEIKDMRVKSGEPATPTDIRQYYNDFLDGPGQQQPFWSHMQGWWDARALPNLLTLHYGDLIADMPGQLRRIAAFLDIPIDEAKLASMVANCSIAHMRHVAADSGQLNHGFEKGAETFINKGTNGRWREVLSQAEIDKCDQIAARELTPDCAKWLLRG